MALAPLDYESIRNLYGRYSVAADTGDVEAFARCFTSDANYAYEGLPPEADRNGAHVGLEDIKAMGAGIYADTQGHCMHWVNPLTIEGDGDRAHVFAYGMVLRRGQGPFSGVILTATARDIVVRSGGEWLYRSRVVRIDPMPKDAARQSKDVLVAARDNLVNALLQHDLA